MKKLIKICVISGAAFLILGIAITSAAAMSGAVHGIGSGVKRAVGYAFGHRDRSGIEINDDDWYDWEDWYDWDDDFWEGEYHRDDSGHKAAAPTPSPDHHEAPAGEAAGTGAAAGGMSGDGMTSGAAGGSGAAVGENGFDAPAGERAPGSGGPGSDTTGKNNPAAGPAAIEALEDGCWQATGIREMDFEIDRGVIRVFTSADASAIQVRMSDEEGKARCYLDDDTLKIQRERKGTRKDVKVEVIVPEGYIFDKVELGVGAASGDFTGIITRKLELEAGVGSITFSGRIDGNVEVEAGVGHVTLNLVGSRTDYNYKIQCGAGSVNVAGDSYTSLGVEHKVDNRAAKKMELECGVGNIDINFIDSL